MGRKKLDLPVNQIIDDYQNGMTITDLTRKYNCSRAPIIRILNEVNIKTNKEKITLICKYCKKNFKVPLYRKDTANFCSKICMDKYRSIHDKGENSPRYKGKIIKICKYCNEEFEVYSTNKKRKFCSRKCYNNWQTENLSGSNSHKYKGKIIKVCEYCKKEFEIHPYRKDTARFCCRDCWCKWRSINERGENHPLYKDNIILTCDYCGDKFEVRPSKSKQNFCSVKCRNNYFKGKNSPTYKGKDSKICKQCGKEFEVYKYRSENAHFCCYECYWESLESSSREYCKIFNENFKISIRTYFGECFMTGRKYSEDGSELSIHHVNYMKNCGCDSSMFCIYIPVTRGWNTKFNGSKKYNRWYWYSHLMKEIFIRYPNYYQFHIPVWGFDEMYYNYDYVFEKFRRR